MPIPLLDPACGSFVISTAEVDCGSSGVSEHTTTFTDVNSAPYNNVVVWLSGEAPTGKDQDELTMDALQIVATPGMGTVSIYIRGLEGNIAGAFRVSYIGY